MNSALLGSARRGLRVHYSNATPEQRAKGMGWYHSARAWCRVMAKEYGISLSVVAGIVAALSPRILWKQNMQAAEEIMWDGATEGVLSANVDKALLILNGEHPLSVLRGNKTRSFYRNLVGDEEAVTLDTIMAKVMDIDASLYRKVGAYDRLAGIVRSEARRQGITPAQYQAVLWVTKRGRSG